MVLTSLLEEEERDHESQSPWDVKLEGPYDVLVMKSSLCLEFMCLE